MMKTDIRHEGETVVVQINGTIDYISNEPFKEELRKIVQDHQHYGRKHQKKVIFDFGNLRFVGSSGISAFIQILKDFSEKTPLRPRYCNVGREFQKVIKAFDEEQIFRFYDDTDSARKSFDQ